MLPRGARIIRLSPAQARLARAGQRAMLAEERQLLQRLRRAADEALQHVLRAADAIGPGQTPGRLLVALRSAAIALRETISAAVLHVRAEARQTARQRLIAELHHATQELKVDIRMPPPGHAPQDAGLAQSAAESYVAAWRAILTVAVMRSYEGSLHRALRAAHGTQQHRLERIAATEVPQAYNDEHDEDADRVAEQHRDARWLPLVVKRWDAKLDSTCAICHEMDGRIVPLGMSFRGGLIPGFVHPRCRCQQAIVVLPLRMRGEVVPGYQVDDEGQPQAA